MSHRFFSLLYIVGHCDMVKLIVWSKPCSTRLCRLPEQESPPCMVRIGRRGHPHRSAQTSASVGADIRIGRRRHPHRSAQTSASVGADIRIGRRRHPHRSAQTSASVGVDVLIGGYGIPAIPTQPPPRHPHAAILLADCVGMAGMPYPPIDSARVCGSYCFA